MKKKWYQSKTVWGAALASLSLFLTQSGLIDPSVISEFIQWFGTALGVYGVRDAVAD